MTLRILVVEPEPHARKGLHAILTSEGHEVSVAEDIPAGLTRLIAQPFDVLLLDSDLPPTRNALVGVLDLLRLARRGDSAVQGILIASCAEDVPVNSEGQGILAVLEKPVDFLRLRQALDHITSNKGRRAALGRGDPCGHP